MKMIITEKSYACETSHDAKAHFIHNNDVVIIVILIVFYYKNFIWIVKLLYICSYIHSLLLADLAVHPSNRSKMYLPT